MRPRRSAAGLLAAVALLAGCGRGPSDRPQASTGPTAPTTGAKGTQTTASADLGFPVFATKNTTRVGGADPIADAAAAARAVYSGATSVTRPKAVVLADSRDWRVGVAAAVLMGPPLRAPLLYGTGPTALPGATSAALTALAPTGAQQAGNAQVVRVGDVPLLPRLRTTDLKAADPIALARAIDAFQAAARGATSDRVLVVSADDPAYAMPAAAWAAKSGDPVLFVHKDELPDDTRLAIQAHQRPKIYVLGPATVIGDTVAAALRKLGTVQRIAGADAASTSVAFARFVDGAFGWGAVDPGHGFVFVNANRPGDAAAAAPLSASGMYGPMLVSGTGDRLPAALQSYLLDVQPGYTRDPVRGVYNHAWIIGDEPAFSAAVQSQIDALLEIVPVNERAASQGQTQTTP